jgi:hypothetical protein
MMLNAADVEMPEGLSLDRDGALPFRGAVGPAVLKDLARLGVEP